jgi:hypothetical protein
MYIAFAAQGLFAQDTNSFHIDSTGRLFVNPGTPVYLYISTSPTGEDAVRVKSIQPEGNPMYWDGHGVHYLTHMDLYLGRKIRFDLFADGLAPKTSPNFDTKEGIQRGQKIFLSGNAVLELAAHDPDAGVKEIYYSVNESEFRPYSQPFTFDKDGEFTVRFYAIDNVGNREDEGERIIVIDTTPPTTTLTINGAHHDEVLASSSRLELNAIDSLSIRHTLYSINSGKDTPYNKPITLSNLSEGEHSISWFSVDDVGNTEETQTYTFFVDRTPPMVFEEISGNTYMVAGREYSSGRSQLRIVAVDNKAGVKEIFYSINNSPFQLYEKPIFLSEITGALTVRSYAIDNVGNKGTSDAQGQQFAMPEVDITGPNITHSFTGKRITLRDTTWIGPNTKININAADKGSGLNRIEYRLSDGLPQEYSASFNIAKEGYHNVNCSAWDNVENLNIASFSFGVDTKAPQLFYHFSVKPHKKHIADGAELNVFSPNMQLFVAATDDKVGVDRITVTVNEGRERSYSQPLSGFKPNQLNTVTLKAMDRLGNESSQTITFWVE